MHAPGLAGDGGQATECHLVRGATPLDSEVCTPQDSEVWATGTKLLNQRVNRLYFRCCFGIKESNVDRLTVSQLRIRAS